MLFNQRRDHTCRNQYRDHCAHEYRQDGPPVGAGELCASPGQALSADEVGDE